MKTINLLVAKLYANTKYGIRGASVMHFVLAQLAVSCIVLYWCYVLLYLLRLAAGFGAETSWAGVYVAAFLVIFYLLNKHTWSLSQVEAVAQDEAALKGTIWVLWAALVVPTVLMWAFMPRGT